MRPISIANEAYFNRQRYAVLPSPKGANVNNRGWNDQRSWNLRIANILSLSIVPKGGEQEQDWMWFAPFGDDSSLSMLVRRFHDLWSFHQRLLKVGPFGDRKLLAKHELEILELLLFPPISFTSLQLFFHFPSISCNFSYFPCNFPATSFV